MIDEVFQNIRVVVIWENGDTTTFETKGKLDIQDAIENEYYYIKINTSDAKIQYINLSFARQIEIEEL